MAGSNVIIVHLRQPRQSNPNEMRSDPFWEFGSFGCTRCHRRNLMNPKKIDGLEEARLAFAQGGPLGFRLVFLSPPVTIVKHANCCEARWKPARMPFRYAHAPVLVDNKGKTDFPALVQFIYHTDRTTWVGKFSSRFRSCRTPLPEQVGESLVCEYERAVKSAPRSWFARSYEEALPKAPPKPDKDREGTYEKLLAKAGGRRGCSCRSPLRRERS